MWSSRCPIRPSRRRSALQASGIPYNDGFIKNRYIGRTFIQPTDSLRKQGVALKFNVIVENVLGKRVVMIDDSIVRGNTTGPLVQLLRQAGARGARAHHLPADPTPASWAWIWARMKT
jgi:glutamine phosphoribosylpyrophosphate amidotransferase